MKNAARKREQSQVYLSYAEREQYRCEASMKNEESMRSIIATPGFQERSDKDFLKDFLGFLAKGNNTYPAAVENSSFNKILHSSFFILHFKNSSFFILKILHSSF